MTSAGLIGIAIVSVVLAGPLILGLAGWINARRLRMDTRPALTWDWQLTTVSALLYVLAFNLTFFIQELFLVLPKAFTPGLRPILFHNNHLWDGNNPLAALFQGTGALATLVSGIACAMLLRHSLGKSATIRLFLFWMAYSGVFMALPQVVIGALSEQSDIGMAMVYLGLSSGSKTIAALLALALMPLAAGWLGRLLLTRVGTSEHLVHAGGRKQFVFRGAFLPALLALPVIVLFRIPREWVEVLLVPLVVTAVGLAWMQAGAWRIRIEATADGVTPGSTGWPLAAVLCLLLIFQVVLRPGIHFY